MRSFLIIVNFSPFSQNQNYGIVFTPLIKLRYTFSVTFNYRTLSEDQFIEIT